MNNLVENIDLNIVLLSVIAFFPIYPMGVISVTIIAFAITSILLFFFRRKNSDNKTVNNKWFLITTGFYLWMIISILYSQNSLYGIQKLQSSISLLVFPAIIFLLIDKLSVKSFEIINLCFVIANILLAIYIHYSLFSSGIYNSFEEVTFWNLPVRDLIMTSKFKELHPTYVSLGFSYSILYLVDFSLKNSLKRAVATVLIFIILFLLITTILLSARITLIAFIIALLVYIVFKVSNRKSKYLIIGIIIAITTLGVLNISYLRSRLIDEFKATELKPPVGESHNSVNIRVGIYQCSFYVLKLNWFFGVGHGNAQRKLNDCYNKFETDVYKRTDYNTHNQYLHIFISAGIIGVILFIAMFILQFKLASTHKDYLYFSFLIIILISFLSENMLSRVHGVLFLYFLILFLLRNGFIIRKTRTYSYNCSLQK